MPKNATTYGELVTVKCAYASYVYILLTWNSGKLDCNARFVGPGGWVGKNSE
jgi:hypothetical protein